jgi:hypothetical protein
MYILWLSKVVLNRLTTSKLTCIFLLKNWNIKEQADLAKFFMAIKPYPLSLTRGLMSLSVCS